MNTHTDKTQEKKSQMVANDESKIQRSSESTFQFVDNRSEAVAQKKLQEMANGSPGTIQLKAFQEMANNSPQAKQTAQLRTMADSHSAQQQHHSIQKKKNKTGLPDILKTGMGNPSGMSLDDVKVNRNSDKPAHLQMHAYAQGTDIDLGPGQEKHLSHEAWHVVQQKQGRVKPSMQMKGKLNVNNDARLEKEADVMGDKAVQMCSSENSPLGVPIQFFSPVVQRTKWLFTNGELRDTNDIDNVRSGEDTPKLEEGDTWDDKTNVVTHAASRLNEIFDGEVVHPKARLKGLPSTRNFANRVGAVPETIDFEDIMDKLIKVFSEPKNRAKLSNTVRKDATINAIADLLKETLPPDKDKHRAILNNGEFAWHMMRIINELAFGQQIPLINTDIGGKRFVEKKDIEQTEVYSAINSFKWTVRHLTNKPGYIDLKSSTELEVIDGIKGENTRDKDWNKLGNTSFGFYLLAINGNVGFRGFLGKMTHYAEFSMDELPGKIFVSGDLLEIDRNTINNVIAYTGSGANVKHELVLLLTHLFLEIDQVAVPTPKWCIDTLEKLMHMLEVKVPKSLRVTEWKQLQA